MILFLHCIGIVSNLLGISKTHIVVEGRYSFLCNDAFNTLLLRVMTNWEWLIDRLVSEQLYLSKCSTTELTLYL